MSRYCICRSKDGGGFMIGCERCDEWYHGKCVGISKKQAKNIDKYVCPPCRKAHNEEIVYKVPEDAVELESHTDERHTSVKQEPLEERKQDRKATETTSKAQVRPVPIPVPVPIKVPLSQSPKKTSPVKRRGTKPKSRAVIPAQCANPPCTKAARQDVSKYCSENCGYAFNKLRYDTFYRPKWAALSKNHSKARLNRMKEIEHLDKEKAEVVKLIASLKEQKQEVEEKIKVIKEQAQKMYLEKRDEEDTRDASSKAEDVEENLTGDSSKTFCITCGMTVPRVQIFKHWFSCYRKHEDDFNLTAPNKSYFEDDDDPNIFCEALDKKTQRYCRHLKAACPFHVNWQGEKDELCGCPLNMMQKLEPDGRYCLELKRDCTLHYHWDKFKLAEINMARIQAYGRLETILEKTRATENQLRDTYGGIIGVMLHNSTDYSQSATKNEDDDMDVLIDV